MADTPSKIIFVYNASSGFFSALSDYVHKIVSPRTYACQLCAVTYGNLGMSGVWRDYIQALPVPVVFTYPDKLHIGGAISADDAFPACYWVKDGEAIQVIDAAAMKACHDLEALIALCDERLGPLL